MGPALFGAELASGSERAPAAEVAPATQRPSAVELALSASWALPQGHFERGSDLSGIVIGQVPLEAGVAWRMTSRWAIGAYGQYGYLVLRDCSASCSGADVRAGVELRHHFTPDERVDHWLAIGIGYEWFSASVGETSFSYRGPEWVSLTLGEEFGLGERAGIGPVFGISLGEYTHSTRILPPIRGIAGSIDNGMVHAWVSFGVRASYGL
jgi:hypothetical protein